MKFLNKLILNESIKHIDKNIHIKYIDYSAVPQVSKEIEDYIIDNADDNRPSSNTLLITYILDRAIDKIQKDPNWRDPEKRIWAKAEKKIALSLMLSFNYASHVIVDQIRQDPDRWKEGEKIISTNPYYSFLYGKNVIKNEILKDPDRWKEGEKTIGAEPEYSYSYATEVIKQQILNDPNYDDPEKRRWREGEKSIASSKNFSYNYSIYVISNQIRRDPNRWREGEKTIAANNTPYEIYHYAIGIIKDQLIADPNRWPEGEKRIASSSHDSFQYAIALKRPFPKGENSIRNSNYFWQYKEFIQKNWNSFTEDQKKGVHPEFLQK